jgi:hypothetical protein
MQEFVMFCLVPATLCQFTHAYAQEDTHELGNRMVGGSWHLTQPAGSNEVHTYEWYLGRAFLKFQGKDGELADSFGLIGRDPSNDKSTYWFFRADGSVEKFGVTVAQEPGSAEVATVTAQDGSELGTVTSTRSKDRIDAENDITLGGVRIRGQFVWERSPEVADLSWLYCDPPQEIPQSMACVPLITGPKWVSGKDSRGAKVTGATIGSWILGGKFFLYSAAGFDTSHALDNHIIIFGIDPATDAATAWAFDASGGVATYRLTDDGYGLGGKLVLAKDEAIELEGRFQKMDDRNVKFFGTVDDVPVSYTFTEPK